MVKMTASCCQLLHKKQKKFQLISVTMHAGFELIKLLLIQNKITCMGFDLMYGCSIMHEAFFKFLVLQFQKKSEQVLTSSPFICSSTKVSPFKKINNCQQNRKRPQFRDWEGEYTLCSWKRL